MSGKRTEKVLQIEAVEVDRLLLDPENRRLEGTVKTTGQAELIKAMWKAMAVNEVALSIAANGVFEEVGQARLTWAGRTVNGRNKFPPARAIQDGHCRQSP